MINTIRERQFPFLCRLPREEVGIEQRHVGGELWGGAIDKEKSQHQRLQGTSLEGQCWGRGVCEGEGSV